MQQRTITCPSGLSGIVSYLRTEDASCLADPKAMRTGKATDQILRACWRSTDDHGPYTLPPDGTIDWGHVLACDRVYATLMIRCATHGDSEELDMKCANCRHKFVWDLPLTQLPVYPLPPASVEKIRARDNRFDAKTADGSAVVFKLMTGHDQHTSAKMLREVGNDIMAAALHARIMEVDGVEPSALKEWINDLSLGDAQVLIDAFEEADGGIETSFDVYCPKCDYEWEVDLPLDLQRMFSPRRRVRRRRQGRRVIRRDQ